MSLFLLHPREVSVVRTGGECGGVYARMMGSVMCNTRTDHNMFEIRNHRAYEDSS